MPTNREVDIDELLYDSEEENLDIQIDEETTLYDREGLDTIDKQINISKRKTKAKNYKLEDLNTTYNNEKTISKNVKKNFILIFAGAITAIAIPVFLFYIILKLNAFYF